MSSAFSGIPKEAAAFAAPFRIFLGERHVMGGRPTVAVRAYLALTAFFGEFIRQFISSLPCVSFDPLPADFSCLLARVVLSLTMLDQSLVALSVAYALGCLCRIL